MKYTDIIKLLFICMKTNNVSNCYIITNKYIKTYKSKKKQHIF